MPWGGLRAGEDENSRIVNASHIQLGLVTLIRDRRPQRETSANRARDSSLSIAYLHARLPLAVVVVVTVTVTVTDWPIKRPTFDVDDCEKTCGCANGLAIVTLERQIRFSSAPDAHAALNLPCNASETPAPSQITQGQSRIPKLAGAGTTM